uniref:Uncharacterized protein n=1 Tax=Saccharum officinarum TaxID=4547 RepID=A0A678T506_SACOF|nr:hypothetical protein SO62J10_000005 [Saccharum officinarum]
MKDTPPRGQDESENEDNDQPRNHICMINMDLDFFEEESAFSKIEKRIELEASMISKEQEKHILYETYKKTTGCRSKKGPGHGYLAKYPTQSQLMNERIEEQARASALAAAAQQKNSEMQAEVENLKEQLTVQAAERESDKEKIQQLQHQLESTSSKIREELRQELFSLIKQQNQAPPLNAAPTTIAPQPTETVTHPSELTTNATGIENMVSENEGADLAKLNRFLELLSGDCSLQIFWFLHTVADSVLLSKQNSILPRVLRSSANKSLFPNDKDSNETVTFITTQTLRNTAANKKRQCRKKRGKEDQP